MKWWRKMFGKDPKDLFLGFSPKGSSWRVVTWNFNLYDPEKRRWTVETKGESNWLIQWERSKKDKKKDEIYFFRDGHLEKKHRMVTRESELISLMNLSIHGTLKHSLEVNREFMLSPVVGATAIDIQNEGKALLWIQGTFGILVRALESLKKDPKLILTAACFSGTVPETGENVLRFLAFNLDIFYYFREDGSLQIVIFDDKNLGHGEAKSPSFQQIIKVTKPQFYDEMIKLVHQFAQGGEIL